MGKRPIGMFLEWMLWRQAQSWRSHTRTFWAGAKDWTHWDPHTWLNDWSLNNQQTQIIMVIIIIADYLIFTVDKSTLLEIIFHMCLSNRMDHRHRSIFTADHNFFFHVISNYNLIISFWLIEKTIQYNIEYNLECHLVFGDADNLVDLTINSYMSDGRGVALHLARGTVGDVGVPHPHNAVETSSHWGRGCSVAWCKTHTNIPSQLMLTSWLTYLWC